MTEYTEGYIRYQLNANNTADVLGLSTDNTNKNIIIKDKISKDGIEYIVLTINNEAFKDTSIESVTIPNSIKIIGDRAFIDIKSLTSINLNEESNLENIGNSAFYGTSIKNIIIPKNVKIIQAGAFNNINKLKSVIFKGDKPNIELYTFSETVDIFSNPPLGYVDEKKYPAWKGINYIDDLVINKFLHIVKIIPLLLIILLLANFYLYIKSSNMIMNIIVGLVVGAIIGMGLLSKQIHYIILLLMCPFLLSIYNIFNNKFSIYIRVPLAGALLFLYKYKFSKMV